ncbi:Uncharacterised protein [Burkholderia pseudomallei]|nr:Uncharacterised protein [Burkholderia pseudomallei]CAJ5623245.1 Uncharacterised protein [Burkholderia pseudomallei]CAK0493663.1 Uncharacterised protein [Burkholderia pseudomallei]
MRTTAHTTIAERVGQAFGRAWLAIRRQDARVAQHLKRQGLPRGVALLIMWAAKLLVLGALLYVSFWLVFLLVVLAIAGVAASHIDASERDESPLSDESDHKKNLFYDPINYNDDPDPRFDDK